MTITGDSTLDARFEPPGPGSWQIDRTHVPRAMPAYMVELGDAAFFAGFSETMFRYGAVLAGLREVLVGGFAYGQMLPADPSEFAVRAENAAMAFATKLWRQDLHRWDTEVKPATSARVRTFGEVDPGALDDDALIAHLRELRDFHNEMIMQHHQFNGPCLIPVGDFLADAAGWTGLPPARVAGALAGASPVSRGACAELDAAAKAIHGDDDAAALLARDIEPADVVGRLRNWPGEVGEAVETWLLLVGHRLIDGFDIAHPYALERPGLLVGALRAAVAGDAPEDGAHAAIAAIRALVPEEHRVAFDASLDEARLVYRLRDERGVYSDSPAAGLVRRAYLDAGRRLAERSVVGNAELAIEATLDELASLLRGEPVVAVDELERRAHYRASFTADDAPTFLGDPPQPPPPLEMLPPPMARVMRAMMTVMGELFETREPAGEALIVRGTGVSGGVVEGRAVIVRTVDDLDRLASGDVLVAPTTSESYNLGLAIASAVVTDHGGALSHAAIIAREYGLPGVVGTGEATKRIPEGATVRVDGDAGEVTWTA